MGGGWWDPPPHGSVSKPTSRPGEPGRSGPATAGLPSPQCLRQWGWARTPSGALRGWRGQSATCCLPGCIGRKQSWGQAVLSPNACPHGDSQPLHPPGHWGPRTGITQALLRWPSVSSTWKHANHHSSLNTPTYVCARLSLRSHAWRHSATEPLQDRTTPTPHLPDLAFPGGKLLDVA